ncbi:unnamed protein product, partial [Didymodactylos carnosus]
AIEPTVSSLEYEKLVELSVTDRLQIQSIETAFLISHQSLITPPFPIYPTHLTDKMSGILSIMDWYNFSALKLINYFKTIPEFDQLDENDRFVLVKHNLIHIFILESSTFFNAVTETCLELTNKDDIQQFDEFYTFCHNDEIRLNFKQLMHTLTEITMDNRIIIYLLINVIIFSTGLSLNEESNLLLSDLSRVHNAQCKYTDLLYRYLIEQYDDDTAVTIFSQLMAQILRIQLTMRNYRSYIRDEIDDVNKLNPLAQTILQLS